MIYWIIIIGSLFIIQGYNIKLLWKLLIYESLDSIYFGVVLALVIVHDWYLGYSQLSLFSLIK